ncbi:MAG: hypothetical protein K0R90_755 [Oscillospiraceae bacterium]|jgi:hypothetical protein|nr:hypothetical protein [Oscillospiraceae bacterium]
MNKNELIESIDKVVPNDVQKQRMLRHVLKNKTMGLKNKITIKRTILACTGLALVIMTAWIFTNFKNTQNLNTADNRDSSTVQDQKEQQNAIGQKAPQNQTDDLPAKDSGTQGNEAETPEDGTDMAIGKIVNVFVFSGREYRILSQDSLKTFGFSEMIDKKDIGSLITTIKSGSNRTYDDKSLVGSKVYEYKPVGSQAVVVVNQKGKNELYMFSSFISYQQNQDEDASEYLKLYNIKSEQDISKIEINSFAGPEERDPNKTIEDRDLIAKYYKGYKNLKNSSDEYFKQLYKPSQDNSLPKVDVPPDYGDNQTEIQGVAPASPGMASDALNNSSWIRVYLKSGIYMETTYYPNIQFLSRYKLTNEFSTFLNTFCG